MALVNNDGVTSLSERCSQANIQFSALFERESCARSSVDRAGGFGPIMAAALWPKGGSGERRAPSYLLSLRFLGPSAPRAVRTSQPSIGVCRTSVEVHYGEMPVGLDRTIHPRPVAVWRARRLQLD